MLSAARTVVAFGIISQAAGFVRLLVIAALFGVGAQIDAYYLALVVPTFLTGCSAGILQSSFIPGYVAERTRGDAPAAVRLRNVALTWTTLALVACSALLTLTWNWGVALLGTSADSDVRLALQAVFVALMWSAPLNGLADAIALVLNAEGRFAAAASAPAVNIVVSTAILLTYSGHGVDALVWSLLAGVAAQLTVVALASMRANLALRPALALPEALPRYVVAVAMPVLISNVLGSFIPAMMQVIASRAGTGAVAALGFASRIHGSVMQTVVWSVSVVLLPHFARLISEARHDELRSTLSRTLAATFLFILASLSFVGVAGQAVIEITLERGRFTHGDSVLVANVWLALTAGLLGATWGVFLARLFQALQRPWVIAVLAVVSVAVNGALTLILMPLWGVVGIAAANSLAYAVVMVAFHILAQRRFGGLLGPGTGAFIARGVAANALGFAAAWLWDSALGGEPRIVIVLGQFVIIALVNLLVARTPPLGISLTALARK